MVNNIQRLNSMEAKITDMKVNIARNNEKIVKNSDTISDVHATAERHSAQTTSMSEKVQEQETSIESLASSTQKQENMMEDNFKICRQQLETLSTRGTWCAYRYSGWSKGWSIIPYDRLTVSDSNMNITSQPLDIKTGNFSLFMIFYLDILYFHIDATI